MKLAARLLVLGTFVASVVAQAPTPESLCTIPGDAEQEKVRKEFGPTFSVVETARFRVVSDCAPRYRKLIAGGLQQFYDAVHGRFFKKEMKRVAVYLIDGAKDYDAFCTKRGVGMARETFGLYIPAQRTIYARRLMPDGSESGFGTLFHEAIHAMVHADFSGDPPSWFNEGFASLFEQGRVLRGEWVYGNPNPWRETPYRAAFEGGKVPPLAKFFALTEKDFRGGDEMLHYNTGRSVCLWLLRRGEDQLARYVDLVRQKKGGVAAIEGASGLKLAEIEASWREHVRKVHFGGDYLHRARGASREQALEILAEGAKLFPDYGSLRAEYANRLANAVRPEDAEREALAALADPRLPTPQLAWSVLVWRYGPVNQEKLAEAAKAIVDLQPWLERLEPSAFSKYAAALERAGKDDEAKKVDAEIRRLKAEDVVPKAG